MESAAFEAQIEPAAPEPKTGTFRLDAVEIEAIRGLSLAQEDLKRRQRVVFEDMLTTREREGARITAVDLDQGTATWSVP